MKTRAHNVLPDLIDLSKLELLISADLEVMELYNYKRFLQIVKAHPTLNAVPTKSIDKIWHLHLSYTDLYAKDCLKYFGKLIVHEENKTNPGAHKANFSRTKNIWEKCFQSNYGTFSSMAFCGVDGDGAETGGDN